MKKILTIIVIFFTALFLVSCQETKFTVTFDTNGGNPTTIESQQIKKGGLVIEPEVTPTKESFIFKYWAYKDTNQKWSFKTAAVYEDFTLTAYYESKTETFSLVLPEYVTADVTNLNNIIKNHVVNLSFNIPAEKTIDKVLVNGIEKTVVDNQLSIKITENTIVEVIYLNESNDSFKLTLPSNVSANVNDLNNIEKGKEVILTITPPVNKVIDKVIVNGVEFEVTNNNLTIIIENDTIVEITYFEEVKEIRVKFDLAYNATSTIEDQIIGLNSQVKKPVDPTREGHTFDGWYVDDLLFDFSLGIIEDLTLIAKWTEINLEDEVFGENFEDLGPIKESGGNYSEYLDADYVGNTEVEWEFTNVRIDLGMKAGGNAITMGGFGNEITDAGMGRIYAPVIHDGIQRIEFEARLPFSPLSTYPQVPGKDKAVNVRIKVKINEETVATLQFADDKEANKGKLFVVEGLNIVGDYSLGIEVSSGHRLTVDNIKWTTNKNGVVVEETLVDFEDSNFDYDREETIHNISGRDFAFKEVYTLAMHPEKEISYMASGDYGSKVARFRGNSTHWTSTPIAYMYNVDKFSEVNTLSFDARLFGSGGYFNFESEIKIFFMDDTNTTWTEIPAAFELGEYFASYELDINKTNVNIKIEVYNGTVNIDNILFK